MISTTILATVALSLVSSTTACFTKRDAGSVDWNYDLPYHWSDNAANGQCTNGTHQSPIPLRWPEVSAAVHRPRFGYEGSWSGKFSNGGHGPKFFLDHPENDYTKLPTMKFDDETVYLQSWHTHTPGEHVVDGDRATAELHFVHVDKKGNPRAVVGFRIDPSSTKRDAHSPFFAQVGQIPGVHEKGEEHDIAKFQPKLALQEVKNFPKFWTYSGSLTSPPCTEGLRWFVSAETMVLGDAQLQELLQTSTYSARPLNHLWLHDVGK